MDEAARTPCNCRMQKRKSSKWMLKSEGNSYWLDALHEAQLAARMHCWGTGNIPHGHTMPGHCRGKVVLWYL